LRDFPFLKPSGRKRPCMTTDLIFDRHLKLANIYNADLNADIYALLG
jgi:hypothetical protein